MDPLAEKAAILGIGLAAGTIGGLTGLGGSIIILPALAFVLGFQTEARLEQHLYMAAAMLVNFVVAVPATWRHTRAGKIRRGVLTWLMPAAVGAMVGGVLLSNRLEPDLLILLLACTIVVFVLVGELSDRALARARVSAIEPIQPRRPTWSLAGTGLGTGLIAGLLGIGGGVVMVASLRAVARLPVRQAIACSAAAMCLMAPIGATVKLLTLDQHGMRALEAIRIAGLMGPAAVLGSLLGSSLVHRLPRRWVKVIVNVVLLLAAAKLAGLF